MKYSLVLSYAESTDEQNDSRMNHRS